MVDIIKKACIMFAYLCSRFEIIEYVMGRMRFLIINNRHEFTTRNRIRVDPKILTYY